MSIDSSLILFRDALPSREQLEHKLSELGYEIDLGKFDPARKDAGWVPVRVAGEKTGFEYGLFPLTREAFGPFPKKALAVGDVALSFGARGRRSMIAVSAVQHAVSLLGTAHGLIEGSLETPAEMQKGCVESIAIFSSAQQVKADRDGPAAIRSARLAEFRQALPRLALIIGVAAIVLFGFPRLLVWLFR